MGMDWKQLMAMAGPMIQQQINQFPPETRTALRETAVYITRDGDMINLDVRFKEGDKSAEQMRGLLLNTLMDAIPQVVKIFGCRVLVKQVKTESKGGSNEPDGKTATTT